MTFLRRLLAGPSLAIGIALLAFSTPAAAQDVRPCPTPSTCQRLVTAKVVALDQPLMFNRLGSGFSGGMVFALKRDVVVKGTTTSCDQQGVTCTPGNVALRADKRPRPIVLRVNLGDCLDVQFTNLLSPTDASPVADVHIMGLELRTNITDDASYVGLNPSSVLPPPPTTTYHYFAKEEGTFMLYSMDDGGTGGQQQSGLFGSVIVEPEGAEYYRSQVTRDVLDAATIRTPLAATPAYSRLTLNSVGATAPRTGAPPAQTADSHPIINYKATYPNGTPVLEMTRSLNSTIVPPQLELIATDLTAIVTGPGGGSFPSNNCSPSFTTNGVTYPERRKPYREFSIHYHTMNTAVNPFQSYGAGISPNMNSVLQQGNDQFGINYGIAGIGPEVLANRLGVGPEKNCVECKFEEFFLSSWTVGDPAMIVNSPANTGATATMAGYADDPSNVYHSYLRDHVKFRIHNAATQAHVHHQHAHQWLHTPDDDNSEYLDSQFIVPGASYTLEIAYGGSGNRNLTAGDSIFHCHFYPHFAQGMWAMWRVHDTFEKGTELTPGTPAPYVQPKAGARALPDGEIVLGTPIPAVVPLPEQAMAPMPAKIALVENGTRVCAGTVVVVSGQESCYYAPQEKIENPGYPFFVPGVGGHRPPHPPCDFAWEGEAERGTLCKASTADTPRNYYDGGLPRHLVLGGNIAREFHTRWDFTKDYVRYDSQVPPKAVAGGLKAFQLPEEGTAVEIAAMTQHSSCGIPSFLPNGDPGTFKMNGLPGVPGAPFANPDSDMDCNNSHYAVRRYKAAVMQTDAVINKKGWHSPQQRMITLWSDVLPTQSGTRPPQPFFFRANSAETVEFWHTNLVPSYYELDDFEVRTPTDILGQHIHLVKFDVLASDGAANGFNYEDGTFSPDDVRDRIAAMNLNKGLYGFDPKTQFINPNVQNTLSPKPPPKEICPTGGSGPQCSAADLAAWTGAQATIQRWATDTLVNNQGVDRTLRTVFTHDHFGPSTHQQVGVYAGLLVEPTCSLWSDSVTGTPMYTQPDGGPTSWQAIITTYKNCPESGTVPPGGQVLDSYREFALEFQDVQLAYTRSSIATPSATQFSKSVLFNSSFSPADWAKIAAGLNAGTVNQQLATQFVQNGIVFPPAPATVQSTVVTANKVWNIQVTNPPTAPPDPEQLYRLEATQISGSTGVTSAKIYTPNITPGWTNSVYALAPPKDGNGSNNTPNGPPYPNLVSAGGAGTYSMNYRNEPMPTRVTVPPTVSNPPANSTDLAYVFASIPRADIDLNSQPTPGACIDPIQKPPSCFTYPAILTPGMQNYDPYTPLLRAYQNDQVQIRTLVGAHVQGHSFQGYGFKWPFEPRADWTAGTSGYRGAQGMGISEHFEMLFKVPTTPIASTATPWADYLYEPSSDWVGLENGLWGMLRAYGASQPDLKPLPMPTGTVSPKAPPATCPASAPVRSYDVVAVNAGAALGGPTLSGGYLVYNNRPPNGSTVSNNPDADPDAVFYVRAGDLTYPTGSTTGYLATGKAEPLILRANAGECVQINLTSQLTGAAITNGVGSNAPFQANPTLFSNAVSAATSTAYTTQLNAGTMPNGLANTFASFGFPLTSPKVTGKNTWTVTSGNVVYTVKISNNTVTAQVNPVPKFAALGNPVSTTTGLHAQLLSYDVTKNDGANVGYNPVQTIVPGAGNTYKYQWYAGDIQINADGTPKYVPVEFGSVPLTPADPLIQRVRSLFGALIIEPEGSQWDQNARATATITKKDLSTFNEFVAVMQDDVVVTNNGYAFNYKTEDSNARANNPNPQVNQPSAIFFSDCNTTITPPAAQFVGDPQTPIFSVGAADVNKPVRLRMVFPGGTNAQVLSVHGHVWQEEPYVKNNQGIPVEIGRNTVSEWLGAQQISPNEHIDMVLDSAGGAFGVSGDYLYSGFQNDYGGLWGLLRVGQAQQQSCTMLTSSANPVTQGQSVTLTAAVSPATATGTVTFYDGVTVLGTSTLNSGKATLTVSTLSAGTHSLAATYNGNTFWVSETVNKP
jgi:manganese oxidase